MRFDSIDSDISRRLRKAIDWETIIKQYDEMVKYATTLRPGTAAAESLLN